MAYANQMMEFTARPPAAAAWPKARRAFAMFRSVFATQSASKVPQLSDRLMDDIGLSPDTSESSDPFVYGQRIHPGIRC